MNPAILLLPAALLILAGIKKETRPLVLWTMRWFRGRELDGERRSNATWRRRARKWSDDAREWHKMPLWQRAAIRTGITVFVLDAAVGLIFARRATEISLTVIGAALIMWAASHIHRRAKRWWPSKS